MRHPNTLQKSLGKVAVLDVSRTFAAILKLRIVNSECRGTFFHRIVLCVPYQPPSDPNYARAVIEMTPQKDFDMLVPNLRRWRRDKSSVLPSPNIFLVPV